MPLCCRGHSFPLQEMVTISCTLLRLQSPVSSLPLAARQCRKVFTISFPSRSLFSFLSNSGGGEEFIQKSRENATVNTQVCTYSLRSNNCGYLTCTHTYTHTQVHAHTYFLLSHREKASHHHHLSLSHYCLLPEINMVTS